jgi:hypothetical protein
METYHTTHPQHFPPHSQLIIPSQKEIAFGTPRAAVLFILYGQSAFASRMASAASPWTLPSTSIRTHRTDATQHTGAGTASRKKSRLKAPGLRYAGEENGGRKTR